ncbi:hypothetical protein MO767_26840 [Pseudomonas sp. UYIF39]|uniref:hypothetical protein n=1 Tax=unclassified Pseudomonas TaxID=196821 RepID=UPI001C5A2716|nr:MULTISPECIES: hypothetical protein [unclassified Pseudomonas]MDI3357930.1 hypothetical protein [Pseudomonas sp. UYIF39]
MNVHSGRFRNRSQLSIRKKINRIRGIVFINAVIAAAGIEREPCALKRLGQQIERDWGLTSDDQTAKWRRFLRGALVGTVVRAALCQRFFSLVLVLLNPLIMVLGCLESAASDLDELDCRVGSHSVYTKVKHIRSRLEILAKSVRFNGRPLTAHSLQSLQQCTFGNWRWLALLLAILASRSSPFEVLRNWLSRHFTLILLLSCLTSELQGISVLLFQVLDRQIGRGVLCPIDTWPSSVWRFNRGLKNLRELLCNLQRHYVGISEEEALRAIHALLIEPKNEVIWVSIFDLHSAVTCIDVSAPEVELIIKRSRKQKYRNKRHFYVLVNMARDPKLVQIAPYINNRPPGTDRKSLNPKS